MSLSIHWKKKNKDKVLEKFFLSVTSKILIPLLKILIIVIITGKEQILSYLCFRIQILDKTVYNKIQK